ncbi:DUF302 domain-containing protein [Marinobacter panjinensis]|uniref:DUF302 domain-containing protein n=1 Tax=Marinobacter panjinensis TaxID=2576384 RepID=A0A4U6R7C8_9GAMM|nr:DUF302 domain-containing protein [Marinobacter panjinensis]MCR8914336.1 DUF302 domain-containing protein [Marinobacter panjinensis]TKV68822.1 DUF302 domain-containing protein [Marinobacter panjinensis]
MFSIFRRLAGIVMLALPLSVLAAEGMVTVKSNHSADATADKLEAVLEEKGMTVMNRINHTAGADKAGLELRPTEVVIFGNPKVGTPLMQCAQSVAIDLPQKALIWEDSEGVVWLGYNDPEYLKQRHNIEGCDGVIEKVKGALAGFAKAATE